MPIKATVTFKDKFQRKTTRIYTLNTDDVSLAVVLVSGIMDALARVTDAQVLGATMQVVVAAPTVNNDAPLPTGANLSDSAHVFVQTVDGKKAMLSVPAAKYDLFVSGSTVLDVAHADMANFALSVFPNVLVSDGEVIDTTQGSSGIVSGIWNSRAAKG